MANVGKQCKCGCEICCETIKHLRNEIIVLKEEIEALKQEKSIEESESSMVETKENDSRRKKIIKEIIGTETSYLEFLNVLHYSFYLPLIKLTAESSQPMISNTEITKIFQNTKEILEINSNLLNKMKKRTENKNFSYETSTFADTFNELFDDENIKLQEEYQKYINNYDDSLNCLKKQKNNSRFQKFLEEILQQHHNFPSIQSYLITPIQRLPRYILMLKDLDKNTPDDHADKENVIHALHQIQTITDQIEMGKDFYEEMLKKETILKRFSIQDQKIIENHVNPQEQILAENILNLQIKTSKFSQRIIILTTNHMIIAQSKKRHHHHPHIHHRDKENNENLHFKLCYCFSFVSCCFSFLEENQCRLIRFSVLERTNEVPFIKESQFIFICDDSLWDFWKNQFQNAIQRNKNPSALLDRAIQTRKHLQSILLSSYNLELISVGAEQMSFSEIPKNERKYLIKKGEFMDNIFYIRSGSIDVKKPIDDQGNEEIISSIFQGDFIGELSFLRSLKKRKSVRSTASLVISSLNTTVTKLSFDNLLSTFNENKYLAWRFYFLLAAITGERLLRVNHSLTSQTSTTNQDDCNLSSSTGVIIDSDTSDDIPNEKVRRRTSHPAPRVNTSSSGFNIDVRKSTSLVNSSTPAAAALVSPHQKQSSSGSLTGIKKPDKKYSSVCKLINEPILQSVSCKFRLLSSKKTNPTQAQLLLSRSSICLYRKIFGKKTQLLIPGVVIEKISIEKLSPNDQVSSSNCVQLTYITPRQSETLELIFSPDRDLSFICKALEKYIPKKNSSFEWKNLPHDNLDLNEFDNIFGDEAFFDRGDVIINSGVLSDCVYQLTAGKCRVEIENSTGVRSVVGTIKSGETFGELSFLLGTVTGAYVIADSRKVSVVKCSWSNLSVLTSTDELAATSFYKYLAQVLCKRLLSTERKLSKKNKLIK